MTGTGIGYARCSTDKQDLTVQREALLKLGIAEDRIYTDHGLSSTLYVFDQVQVQKMPLFAMWLRA